MGIKEAAKDGITATAILPLSNVNLCFSSFSTLSHASTKDLAIDSSFCPSAVNKVLLVVRVNKRPPKESSKLLIDKLTAGCDMCTSLPASAKLWVCATAKKIRSCFTFITKPN